MTYSYDTCSVTLQQNIGKVLLPLNPFDITHSGLDRLNAEPILWSRFQLAVSAVSLDYSSLANILSRLSVEFDAHVSIE